jgi:hypothetical protein
MICSRLPQPPYLTQLLLLPWVSRSPVAISDTLQWGPGPSQHLVQKPGSVQNGASSLMLGALQKGGCLTVWGPLKRFGVQGPVDKNLCLGNGSIGHGKRCGLLWCPSEVT